MKRKILLALVSLVLLTSLMGCATDTPWRKATVTTFELVGITQETSKSTTESLRAQNLITDEQLGKVKVIYNKARLAYLAAGNALKLAGKAESAVNRDQLLAEYDKLLTEFRALAYQIYDLIKGFQKVSYNDVLEIIKQDGGESWVQQL